MSNFINYTNLYKVINKTSTFNDVGSSQNILKTAVFSNIVMLFITIAACLTPIPFFAPISIIVYIIGFSILNIKYAQDFVTAVYQYDNKQIQYTKTPYDQSENKLSGNQVKGLVESEIETEYQKRTNIDTAVSGISNYMYGSTSGDLLTTITNLL